MPRFGLFQQRRGIFIINRSVIVVKKAFDFMSIFGGVEPPRWLQEIAKPVDARETGQELGFALGAGILALQKDPETGKMKGIQQGIAEARMNTADPQWQLKSKALEADTVAKWANAYTGWQAFDYQKDQDAAWINHDLPLISELQKAREKDPNAQLSEPLQSDKGQKWSQQDESFLLRKEIQATRMQDAQNRSASARLATRSTERFQDALESLPPDVSDSVIAQIGDPNGPKIGGLQTYSDTQWSILKDALSKSGMPMPGQKAASAERLTPEQKTQLEDLKGDESDIRKAIIASAGDDQKIAALRKQLKNVQSQRYAIASGKQPTTTNPSAADEYADELSQKKDAYRAALLGDDSSKISVAEKELQSIQTKIGRAEALEKGYVVDSSKLNQSVIEEMKKWPDGVQFFDAGTKRWKTFYKALLPALESQLNKPQTGATPDQLKDKRITQPFGPMGAP